MRAACIDNSEDIGILITSKLVVKRVMLLYYPLLSTDNDKLSSSGVEWAPRCILYSRVCVDRVWIDNTNASALLSIVKKPTIFTMDHQIPYEKTQYTPTKDISLSQNEIKVHPQLTSDALDPLNWSRLQKNSILGIVMLKWVIHTLIRYVYESPVHMYTNNLEQGISSLHT